MGEFLLIIIVASLSIGFLQPLTTDASPDDDIVYTVDVSEDIDAGTSHYVRRAISRAEEKDAPLIIKLDTPGGLVQPTKEIVDKILSSDITVVTWVSPEGAWAYSAGTYILMASDVAALDKATGFGAAEPRPSDNKTVSAMINWIEEIAESQNRPKELLREFVTNNRTFTAEAIENRGLIEENLVELIARGEGDILDYLERGGSETQGIEKDLTADILSVLSSPQIAIILLIIGVLGIVAEVTTGGVGVPGIGGGICLLLAFLGLRVMEVSGLGLALTALGVVLLAAEIFEPGFGAFGIGGGITLFLGVLFIGDEPWTEVSGILVKGTAIALIVLFGAFIWVVRKTQRKEVETGMEAMIDSKGTVTKKIDPVGVARVRGERWRASADEKIEEDEEIIVEEISEKDGQTTLIVERVPKD